MIQSEAKKRNHPKVSTGFATTNIVNLHREENKGNPPSKPRPEIGQILRTIAASVSSGVPTKETTMPLKRKHSILHNMPGHDISECRAFESITVREPEEGIFQEKLCYCCVYKESIRRVSTAVSVELSETQTSYTWAGKKRKENTQRKRTTLTRGNSRKVRKREYQRQSRWTLMQQNRTSWHLQRRPSWWRGTTPGTPNHSWSFAKRRLLASGWSWSCGKPDRFVRDVQDATRSHVGSRDGRSATRQIRSRPPLYQRRHWRVWTMGGADKEDNRRSSKTQSTGV